MNLAIEVVATLPLTVEVNWNVLVEVDTSSILVVPPAITLCKLVEASIPFTFEVNIVPDEVREFEDMVELVAIDPPTLEVKVLPDNDRVLFVFKLVIVAVVATKLLIVAVPVAVIFVPVALPNNNSVKNEVIALNVFVKKLVEVPFVVTRLVIVALLNTGLSVNIYVTFPSVVVATVRLELVDEARNVYRLAIDVVAITPLILVVTIPFNADIVEEDMIVAEEVTPLIALVKVLAAFERALEFMKLAVVVANFPLTVEESIKELVEVDIVKVCSVEEATRFVKSVDVAIPLIVVVKVVPLVEIPVEVITLVVAETPLIVVVNVLSTTF